MPENPLLNPFIQHVDQAAGMTRNIEEVWYENPNNLRAQGPRTNNVIIGNMMYTSRYQQPNATRRPLRGDFSRSSYAEYFINNRNAVELDLMDSLAELFLSLSEPDGDQVLVFNPLNHPWHPFQASDMSLDAQGGYIYVDRDHLESLQENTEDNLWFKPLLRNLKKIRLSANLWKLIEKDPESPLVKRFIRAEIGCLPPKELKTFAEIREWIDQWKDPVQVRKDQVIQRLAPLIAEHNQKLDVDSGTAIAVKVRAKIHKRIIMEKEITTQNIVQIPLHVAAKGSADIKRWILETQELEGNVEDVSEWKPVSVESTNHKTITNEQHKKAFELMKKAAAVGFYTNSVEEGDLEDDDNDE